jgi:PAS domain S-box-containing protein
MFSKATEFEGLLEAVPDALVGVDKAGVIRFVNHQTESLFDYERADLVGAPVDMLVPVSLRQAHVEHRESYATAPKARPMGTDAKLSGRRRDGTEFPVDMSLSPSEPGDDMLVIAAVRDMTHYRSAEADRRRADRLLSIVEYSEDAIIGKTLDGIITSWNPAAERMYGHSNEEIIGKSVDLLSPEGAGAEIMAILAKIKTGEHVDHFETNQVRKDGTVFPVSLGVSPIRDTDGAIVGVSTIARDVSDTKRTLEAARFMIESSLDSLVAISPEGKITDANRATVHLTGVPRDQLIGTDFSNYFTDPKKAEEIYQRVFSEGMARDYPLTMRHQDGHETLTEVLYNASVYRDIEGAVVGVIAAARDVTELMHALRESADQQAKALERLTELEQFQALVVGRELKMIELKKEIESLRKFGPANGSDPDDQY